MAKVLIIKDTILVHAHAVMFNASEDKNASMETVFQPLPVILFNVRAVSNVLMTNVYKFKYHQSVLQMMTAHQVKCVMNKNAEL